MLIDRSVKILMTVIALALVVIAARPLLSSIHVSEALRPGSVEAQNIAPRYEISIPKSWGKLISFSNNNLLLEATDGSLRIVDVDGKSPEYPKVKVLIHWQ